MMLRNLMTVLLVSWQLSMPAVYAQSQEAVEGDSQAWSEVKGAYERLTKLRTYRARHPGDPSVVEVVNPDRFHYILQLGYANVEFVIVGDRYAERMSVGDRQTDWRCFPARPGLPYLQKLLPPLLHLTLTKQLNVQTVKISRLGENVVERDKTQAYQYEVLTISGTQIRERLFVLERGLPRCRTEVLDSEGKVLRTLGPSVDYQDFDAAINITFPRC